MTLDLRSPISRVIGVVIGLALWIGFMEIRGCIAGHQEKAAAAARTKEIDARISKGQKIDAAKVPDNLSDLIPLAEKWGWGDEEIRDRVIEKASLAEKRLLTTTVTKDRMDQIETWLKSRQNELVGSALRGENNELSAFVGLVVAAQDVAAKDDAKRR